MFNNYLTWIQIQRMSAFKFQIRDILPTFNLPHLIRDKGLRNHVNKESEKNAQSPIFSVGNKRSSTKDIHF